MGVNHKMRDKLKLVWCSPHHTHYNAYLFDHLAELKDVSFHAVYFFKTLDNYPWTEKVEADYDVTYLYKILGVDWKFLWKKINAKNELLVIAGWNEPTLLLLTLWFAITGRPYVLYSDTPEIKKRRGAKQLLRKKILNFLFKKIFKFLVTGKQGMINAQAIGVPIDKIVNFPFATNTDFFIPALKKHKKSFHFVSSGRLDNDHKAYDIAIKAFALLKNKKPQYDFHYTIAGEGPDRNSLMKTIEREALQDNVSLLGWLEAVDLLPFYQSGDVFIHPSHFDPFPNAVLEAMACGLPIVGSDTAGSVVDRVIEKETGYIHRANDVNDLYLKLIEVYQLSSEEFITMGNKARQVAEDWDVSYHKNVIDSIIHEYKGGKHDVIH